jgi:SAM-dependent methyltransferase
MSETGKIPWTLQNGEVVQFPLGMRQETALRLVEPGHALLDVGCGRGAVAAALAPRFSEVQRVDADPDALEVARALGVLLSVGIFTTARRSRRPLAAGPVARKESRA